VTQVPPSPTPLHPERNLSTATWSFFLCVQWWLFSCLFNGDLVLSYQVPWRLLAVGEITSHSATASWGLQKAQCSSVSVMYAERSTATRSRWKRVWSRVVLSCRRSTSEFHLPADECSWFRVCMC